MKTRWKVAILTALLLLISAVILAGFAIHSSLEVVRDSYAEWDASLAIIHHMKEHGGAWPNSWNELKQAYETTPDLRGPEHWEELKQRVDVDFQATPSQLVTKQANDNKPPFKVVWLRNGKAHHWEGAEPNAVIFEYLKTVGSERQVSEKSPHQPL